MTQQEKFLYILNNPPGSMTVVDEYGATWVSTKVGKTGNVKIRVSTHINHWLHTEEYFVNPRVEITQNLADNLLETSLETIYRMRDLLDVQESVT